MTLKEFSLFIFNGGLDPELVDPSQLRRRRTLATTWILLLPVGVILLFTNSYFIDATDENIEVGIVILVALAGLYLQAFKNWERFASYSLVFTFWLSTTSVMFRNGIDSANWTWMLSGALLANLIASRTVAVVYTVVAVITLTSITIMSNADLVPSGLDLGQHGMVVAIVGSLGLCVMTILGYTFRSFQNFTEATLKTNLLRLEQEVDTRQKAEQDARAAQQAKADFLATVSHELRTPLNGVLGAGHLLQNTELYKVEPELINTVNRSGDLLLDLINNVLDLSRLEAGRLELEQATFHANTVLYSAIAPIKILGADKDMEVSCFVDASVPDYLIGDPTRIRQIILNLCGNLLRSTDQRMVKVSAYYDNGELTLMISDVEVGLARENLTATMEDLRQSHGDLADSPKIGELTKDTHPTDGVGLELSIVTELLKLFAGKITVQSKPGLGTIFTVVIPLTRGMSANIESTQLDQKSEDLGVNLTVLVTDDNAINRKVVSKMLEQLGCVVVEAVDGQQALTALTSNEIDVVLMDVNMPVMDGLTATTRIREMGEPFRQTIIIGLTANALPDDKGNLLAAGMDDALTKPLRLEALRTALQHHGCQV